VAQLGSVGVRPSDLADPPPRELFTPWVAPELQDTYGSGDEILTTASDIYSLGRLLLAMTEVYPTDLATVDAREALKMLAEKCLVIDPEKRPTAFDLLGEIDKEEDMDGKPFLPLMSSYDIDGVATLEEAAKWRVVPSSRHQYGVVIHNHDAIYLVTSPINGKGEHPVRMISFEIRCHDQGAERTSEFNLLLLLFDSHIKYLSCSR
jgi:serine/threonine protein kinase